MKRFFYCLVVCIIVFSSCSKKTDDVIINGSLMTEAIKSQLASVVPPSQSELATLFVESGPTTKSAKILSIINVYPLAEETYEIVDEYGNVVVIKPFSYYELDADANRMELITVKKHFVIKDGKIDISSYSLTYLFGCPIPLSKVFFIDTRNAGYIQEITCIFRFADGRYFAYHAYNNIENGISLPNLADGKWEIEVMTDDGDISRCLTTGAINFSSTKTELSLKLKVKLTNIISQCKIGKEKLLDVKRIRFVSEDTETANEIFIDIPFRFDAGMSENILFDLPFYPKKVILISDTTCEEYYIEDNFTQSAGQKRIYFLE